MWEFIVTGLVGALFGLVPGVLWLLRRDATSGPVMAALIVVTSSVAQSLTALALAVFRVPVLVAMPLLLVLTALVLWRARMRQWWRHRAWWWLLGAFVVVVLFCVPFVVLHSGLPTGDSQKAIFWAQDILDGQPFPQYGTALARLNRDQVDFFTPALHAVTASVMAWSPAPLSGVGVFSIVVAVGTALVGAALLRALWPALPAVWPEVLVLALTLTQFRFLRYLREPGYHYQNVVGELLLFGALLIGIRLIERWRWSESALAVLAVGTLALTHQYSAFIAGFALLPIVGAILWQRRRVLHSARELGIPLAGLFVMLIVAWQLGVLRKASHFFTAQPHLLPLTPNWLDYPTLMGTTWLVLGVTGLVWGVWQLRQTAPHRLRTAAFLTSVLVLLALSQGPRLGIDIPPVRALLYTAVPLSLLGGYVIVAIWQAVGRLRPDVRGAALVVLVVLVGGASVASLTAAYQLNHRVRTDSTVTVGELTLATDLAHQLSSGAILTDDYNRRSSSWLVLSGRAMFTRLASALERPMEEATQSSVRRQTYLANLDYEKMYDLGSWPGSLALWSAHDIAAVTGVAGSSDAAFAANPALASVAAADGLTLYTPTGALGTRCVWGLTPQQEQWLLAPTTLANDIGDGEDTFAHLPVSVQATRMSQPETLGACTRRVTRAPLIPVVFNVGDYVRTLWDQDGDNLTDGGVQFVLVFTAPVPGGAVVLPDGTRQLLTSRTAVVTMPVLSLPEDGHVTVLIENPAQTAVGVDLVAGGLTQVP